MILRNNADRRHIVSGLSVAALAALVTPGSVLGQNASPDASGSMPEEARVGATMMQMGKGMAMRDADMVASVYTENAEWLNAFGDWRVGRSNIHAKLTDLFASDEFNAGKPVGEPTGSVRVLSDTNALAWTYKEIEGQLTGGTGELIPLRKNHSLAVLEKVNGSWLITAHMFMDENIVD